MVKRSVKLLSLLLCTALLLQVFANAMHIPVVSAQGISGSVNIAPNGTPFDSGGGYYDGASLAALTDGNQSTTWQFASKVDQGFFGVTFGENRIIDGITIMWETASRATKGTYRVLYSFDGNTFKEPDFSVTYTENGGITTDTITFNAVSAKKIKIVIGSLDSDKYSPKVYEFGVYSPSQSSSLEIEINNNTVSVTPETTVAEVLEVSNNIGDISSADGNKLSQNESVTTGDYFMLNSDKFEFYILGDVNGDGNINSTDFTRIRRTFLGLYTLSGIMRVSADINGDSNINSTDFMQVRRHFLGMFDIFKKEASRVEPSNAMPSNEINEDELPVATDNVTDNSMLSGIYKLAIDGGITLYEGNNAAFGEIKPIKVYIKSNSGEKLYESTYTAVSKQAYGILATANFTTDNGSQITVEDRFYFPKENEEFSFNVRRAVLFGNVSSNDLGFASEFSLSSMGNTTNGFEWFVPNNLFNAKTANTTLREIRLGLPMMMVRNAQNGYTLSLARYQPIISYVNDSFASFTAFSNNSDAKITLNYPAADGGKKYHKLGESDVFDLTLRIEKTEDYSAASSSVYNAHFNLQNQRIADTDIDEVYEVINEDFKSFVVETPQTSGGRTYMSYGLPWRIYLETGELGPLTYQSGFVGQQLPAAYNMMLYGAKNDDAESMQNGINIIDFWIDDAKMLSDVGVPHTWYDTWDNGFRAYPSFLRMQIDSMEGILDAYRLSEAEGMKKSNWYAALIKYSDFLVNYQNDDGSFYRCYNYDGGAFKNGDNGIPEPSGNICQSESKANTGMAVRFLGRMYELTGEEKYKTAAIKAGEYVYKNIYPLGYYNGGTCDNPNAVDKEAGVYAMYCYDAMYMLTGEDRWIDCLKQATAFTMSTVVIPSFYTRNSELACAVPMEAGCTDGLSFIVSGSVNVDNYIAYIYYELFRIYIITGDTDYLKQAQFIQNNTKQSMNWDGALGYKYKSLVTEASSFGNFNYGSTDVWLPWCSVANVEPIAKMITNFGNADVMAFENTDIEILRNTLNEIGVGGNEHIAYN